MIYEKDKDKMKEQLAYSFENYAYSIRHSGIKWKDSKELLSWAIFEFTCNIRDAIAAKEGREKAALFMDRVLENIAPMANKECLDEKSE